MGLVKCSQHAWHVQLYSCSCSIWRCFATSFDSWPSGSNVKKRGAERKATCLCVNRMAQSVWTKIYPFCISAWRSCVQTWTSKIYANVSIRRSSWLVLHSRPCHCRPVLFININITRQVQLWARCGLSATWFKWFRWMKKRRPKNATKKVLK